MTVGPSKVSRDRPIKRETYVRHANDPEADALLATPYALGLPNHGPAQRAYETALRTGALVNPRQCERCPSTHRIGGHHDNYNEPLSVQWLCQRCHSQRHRELKSARIGRILRAREILAVLAHSAPSEAAA